MECRWFMGFTGQTTFPEIARVLSLIVNIQLVELLD